MSKYTAHDQACANAIRTLTLDAIQKAESGHPGMPMGMADVAYVLYKKFMRFNPREPWWFNRDRFVVSAGHGSMLPYALLYLTGDPKMTLDEIKRFRQLGSQTPGHPENHITQGIEVTTGPLGAGTANSVGMALAEAWMAAKYNRDGLNVVDHFTYAIVSDGDLQEGVSHESASLAGHLGLGKLIWFYDDNGISIDGPTSLSYSDDVPSRFAAYGWHTQVIDGHDMGAIEQAIVNAQDVSNQPSIICCKTIIGKGMPNRQGTQKAHSDAPGEEEVRLAKTQLGADPDQHFYVPEAVLAQWRDIGASAAKADKDWELVIAEHRAKYPELAEEFRTTRKGILPKEWDSALPTFNTSDKPIATRAASGMVINAIIGKLPALLGGSADLTPSNNTLPKDAVSIKKGAYGGRYIRFGIREHGMGGILNGMALHGGVIPYGGTFFTFSDYLRPTLRLAAISHAHSIFVFTHDSIGVGEDGPTHQPVEQLASLRAIPNLLTIRPADANETALAWKVAIEHKHGPVALLLTRQALPILPKSDGLLRGGYVINDVKNANVQLIASGSEVSLALESAKALAEEGIRARVVSLPCWGLFDAQLETYRASVILPQLPSVVIEAGVSLGWHKYVGLNARFVTVETFGASAPVKDVFKAYGFTVENVKAQVKALF
jgi:transketolase